MTSIEVRTVEGKGRGVYALRPFRAGELIERSPVIVLPGEQSRFIEETELQYYWYDWRTDEGSTAFALGYGMLYNHSYRPNAVYVRRFDEQVMDYLAVRDIAPGEEICINYNGRPDDSSEVWFDVLP